MAPRNVNTARTITWLIGIPIYCTVPILNNNPPPPNDVARANEMDRALAESKRALK